MIITIGFTHLKWESAARRARKVSSTCRHDGGMFLKRVSRTFSLPICDARVWSHNDPLRTGCGARHLRYPADMVRVCWASIVKPDRLGCGSFRLSCESDHPDRRGGRGSGFAWMVLANESRYRSSGCCSVADDQTPRRLETTLPASEPL